MELDDYKGLKYSYSELYLKPDTLGTSPSLLNTEKQTAPCKGLPKRFHLNGHRIAFKTTAHIHI